MSDHEEVINIVAEKCSEIDVQDILDTYGLEIDPEERGNLECKVYGIFEALVEDDDSESWHMFLQDALLEVINRKNGIN